MKFILKLIKKLKSLIGNKTDLVVLKELEFEELKKRIIKINCVVDLRICAIDIEKFMKKFKLSIEGNEFKILKSYVKIQKLKIKSKSFKKNNII